MPLMCKIKISHSKYDQNAIRYLKRKLQQICLFHVLRITKLPQICILQVNKKMMTNMYVS